jgi:hypothetical protein
VKAVLTFLTVIVLTLAVLTACVASHPAAGTQANHTTTPDATSTPVEPTLTVIPDATDTATSAARGQPAHLAFNLDLTGAAPASGSYQADLGGDFTCSHGPFYELFGTPVTSVGESDVTFTISPDASLAMKPGGMYPLSKQGDLVVAVGNESFVLGSGTSAAMTIRQDGSGSLTFRDLQDTADSSKQESGTVAWTCQQ